MRVVDIKCSGLQTCKSFSLWNLVLPMMKWELHELDWPRLNWRRHQRTRFTEQVCHKGRSGLSLLPSFPQNEAERCRSGLPPSCLPNPRSTPVNIGHGKKPWQVNDGGKVLWQCVPITWSHRGTVRRAWTACPPQTTMVPLLSWLSSSSSEWFFRNVRF